MQQTYARTAKRHPLTCVATPQVKMNLTFWCTVNFFDETPTPRELWKQTRHFSSIFSVKFTAHFDSLTHILHLFTVVYVIRLFDFVVALLVVRFRFLPGPVIFYSRVFWSLEVGLILILGIMYPPTIMTSFLAGSFLSSANIRNEINLMSRFPRVFYAHFCFQGMGRLWV